jgi:hypothetical protein
MPAAALLVYLPFLLECRQHAVQVVLLDVHLRRELGDGDSRLTLHERQRLRGARATAFAPSGTTFRGNGRGRRRRGFAGGARWTAYFFAPRRTPDFFGSADFFGTARGTAPFFSRRRRGRRFAHRAGRTPGSTAASGPCGRGACGRSGGGCRPADSVKRRCGCREAFVLLNDRAQLVQSRGDLSTLLIKEVGHDPILFTSTNVSISHPVSRHSTPFLHNTRSRNPN